MNIQASKECIISWHIYPCRTMSEKAISALVCLTNLSVMQFQKKPVSAIEFVFSAAGLEKIIRIVRPQRLCAAMKV